MSVGKSLNTYAGVFCICLAFAGSALADAAKDRAEARSNLKNGQYGKGLTALIQLSNNGDDDSSYILGRIFAESKIPQIPRNITRAEFYLLRGAKNCHEKSMRAIGALIYKKRGSKLFDPAKAKRLERLCDQKSQITIATPEPTSKKPQTPTSPAPSHSSVPTVAQSSRDSKPVITASVRNAWAIQKPSSDDFGGGASGVAISADGVFLTNHHVVDGCRNLAVKYQNMLASARLIFADEDLDLAAIKVAAPTPFFATFDASELRLGETLVALGYPVNFLFGSEPSVAEGRLTNTDDGASYLKESGFLLVSIPLASGNSGGPVYNSRGLLRGVVSYGFDTDNIIADLKERGADVAIDTVTFNFIVSGLSIMDRLRRKGVSFHKQASSNQRLDVEELAARGKMSLANVKCG